MPKIFVYGDSHTRALKDAVEKLPKDNEFEFEIHWMLSEKDGISRGDMAFEEAKAVVASLQPRDIVVISLLGTAHNVYGLLAHERPYCVLDAEFDGRESLGCELIPANTMLDMFTSFCHKNKRVAELKNHSVSPVYHLMTPPPKEDNDYIKSKISRYRDKAVSEYGLNSSELRLSLWKLEMRALRSFCAEIGVVLVSPPAEALSESGFLKADYYAGDATHANRFYGGLVLRQLQELTIAPRDEQEANHEFD